MLFRINLLVGALALIAASGAMPYDKGTKATAMQNIEDRPIAPQVTQSVGPVLGEYDRGTKATAMQNTASRPVFAPVSVAPAAEVAGIHTQRAAAADVSFPRGQATEGKAVEYKPAVKHYDRGTKATAMQNIQNQ